MKTEFIGWGDVIPAELFRSEVNRNSRWTAGVSQTEGAATAKGEMGGGGGGGKLGEDTVGQRETQSPSRLGAQPWGVPGQTRVVRRGGGTAGVSHAV